MPLVERLNPLLDELLWVLLGRPDPEHRKKTLPDYCYSIFDVFEKTFFKGFPLLSETVQITDEAAFQSGKTIEDAKKALQLNWKNLGRLYGIVLRCIRFAELEAKSDVEHEIFYGLTPDEVSQFFTMIFGRQWVETNRARIVAEAPGKIMADMLNQYIASRVATLREMEPKWNALAFQWGPEAMEQFHAGMAEGMASFLDETGHFVGESGRAGIYSFLLLVWNEIKAMQESIPGKTLTDLHKWMQPFMRVGMVTYIEIDTLRDVCAPPSQFGIGLQMRKLSVQLA